MWKRATFVACVLMAAAAAQAQPAEGGAEDDLAVVKRAVEKEDAAPTPQARRAEARWFRVRIEERDGTKVKINLPLGLVRELDDQVPFDWNCGRKHHGCRFRLSEVLDQLDSGQDLVEIKDAASTVRIWVD